MASEATGEYKVGVQTKALPLWAFCSLLLLVTAAVFYPVLNAYFVNLDDPAYLINNAALTPFSKEWSWGAAQHFFTADATGNYIPLTTLTYAVEKYFFAPDTSLSPFIFHLDNLLLHLGCTLCVFFIFLKMGVSRWGAFIGALLFGIHPMRVESVAWVTERKDVLYGLFFLLSLLSYINYIKADNRKGKWYVPALVCFIFSCFAKVQAVCLPLCMVAMDIYFKRNWYAPKVLVVEKLAFWILAIMFGCLNVYILATQKVINSTDALIHYNVVQKLALAAYAYAVYVIKFIYPYRMLAYYAFPVTVPGIAYVCLGVVPVLLVVTLWWTRRNRIVLFGILFFTCNVIFMLQIVAAGSTYLSDRYTYIAYIGLFFLIATGYDWAIRNFAVYRKPIAGVLALYCLMLGFMTFNQTKVWHNDVALWQHYADEKPNDYYGYYQLGGYYTDVLLYHIPDPNVDVNAPGFNTLPARYLDTAYIKDSLNGRPIPKVTANILLNRGVACEFTQDYAGCITNYTRALAVMPTMKEALAKRGWTYFYIKKYDAAMQDFNRYEQLDTTDAEVYYHRALCEGTIQQLDKGLRDVTKAIAIDGANPQYYITRSDIYKLLGRPDAMRADAQKAQSMGGDVPRMLLQ